MHNLRAARFILGIETSDIPNRIFTSQAMISSPKTTVLPQAMVFKSTHAAMKNSSNK
jgi:hypothetical protein